MAGRDLKNTQEDMHEALLSMRAPLRRYARSLTRTEADAEDLVQEAFARAFQAAGRGEQIRHPGAFLMRLTRNLFVDTLRGHHREAKILDFEAFAREGAIPAAQEKVVELREVMDAMETLPEEQRCLLWSVAVEGESYADTARDLGLPEGTVTSRLSRARQTLRRAVG